ncbi:ribonuclease P protein component [Candidatus Falkowbacteria bacterium]|nr:ribonuclease P protein component [Candidatus Falkowbacteria bacterium]
MLAKQSRLAKDKDFKKVFKGGKLFYSRIFVLKILANGLKNNRYGFVISSKVSKKSVERNKLKRQFKEVVKEFDKNLVLGLDLVVIVSPTAKNCAYKLIKSELLRAFSTLKLFKPGK